MIFIKKQFRRSDPFVIQEGSIKSRKLKRDLGAWELEQPSSSFSGKKETIGRSFDVNKIFKINLALLLFFGFILGRAGWLSIARGGYYHELAEGNRIRVERIEAKRGVIYDRFGRPLVRNSANFLLYFVPADLPKDKIEQKKIIQRVSEYLGNIKPDEIVDSLVKIKSGSLESYQPLFIADNIDYEKALALYLAADIMPGVILTNKTRREYNLFSLSLSHILGYTGKINEAELTKFGQEYLPIDYIGKTGMENFWENEMKGLNGKKQIEVDALGKEKKIINQAAGQDGHNLVLSIDIELQKKLAEAVISALQKLRLNKACAIALDPNNGEILAMVSLPSYNNNDFARGLTQAEYASIAEHPDQPLFNRCIAGEYPSGSVIKPVVAAAALEEGIINENTSFNSAGGIKIDQWFFPDWKAGGHGYTNVRSAIANSVNTFFYYIGGGYQDFTGLGLDRMVRYEKLFGLDAQTGVDLLGEANGFLPSKEWKETTKGERWYIGDTYHLAIGQGDLLVTPLQVADYTAVFANGGSLYRPHLIKQVLNHQDQLIGEVENKPIRSNMVSAKNIEIVRQGLRQTITQGSAQSLQDVVVSVAGKTGTAQWSTVKPPHAWFTGFAPYDKPQIVITILIEQGGEGSAVAVPIAQEVLDWYFSRK
ncbi:MAG: Penicillin-binding protein 2 [Parcubacteria group bacterium GW2011_GWC2_42_12]|uniref:Penicillin-binding protein 2 n=2 Tax=Candidatus Falkowiibacteriota TaxID=1752728 RepID=A0A1F5S8E7_9BACT|nr:MAG: Penicillin-binding protein 2 [Candidatus Falkowbacteria bacterium GW2011_GWA2_41_14]KKS35283.1 MAG: Penicillin-binding protein 2 [Parcubacteria group bacterium GW2011_GWC2_42_12]OGF22896.1 MAG: penicillin-binding protein 2 [Candidatus Falkowbacteria bacterium RIFCSPHIGHO2_02_FULL_42_9]